MKPRANNSIVTAAAILLTVAVIAAVVWVAATTEGTRWLLTSAPPLIGVEFSARKIEGSIIGQLQLTKVQVGLGRQKVEIDHLELSWKPLLLLAGTVGVRELVIRGVRIQDDSPPGNEPPNLVWPRASKTGQLFDGSIARLSVTDISYRRLQELPVPVTSIAGSVIWQGGLLTISDLKVVSPSGQLDGSISASFNKPFLTADLVVVPAQSLAEMDRFSLQVRQSQDKGSEPFTGMFAIAGNAGTRKLLELSGDVGMEKDAINLRRLTLTRPEQKGRITADGSLTFKTVESLLSLQIKADGLDLAPELNVPTNLSGTLKFEGTPDNYHGEVTLENQAQGWQAATVSASYEGTLEGMKLAPMNARVLDGSLAGTVDMNWRSGFVLEAVLSGSNLNPARFDPAWKGVANFSVAGKLAWSGKNPVTGSVRGTLLESRLHGQALTGDLQADFSGDNISFARLALKGKGFDLNASGDLDRRLTLSAVISDLSGLVPGTAGTLRADGWLRRHDGQLTGSVTGSAYKLAYEGMRTAAADVTARLDQGAGYPVHVTASLKDVIYNDYSLNAVKLAVDGTLLNHSLKAALRSGGSEAGLTIDAGYGDGVWKGKINTLSGRDSTGRWNLTAPATFAASAGSLTISPLALGTGAAEHLEISAEMAFNPLSGQIRAQWSGINLARLKPWLPPETTVEGRISGRANGVMLPGQGFELDGNALLSGGTLRREGADGELNLSFKSATTSWSWRGEALSGTLALIMAEYGQAQGTFQLPVPARFPVSVNPKGPLRASLAGQVQEKGIITTLFPGLVQESSGVLDAELSINGTWDTPQVGGKVQLTKAAAYLPSAGIHLKDVQLTAHLGKDLIRIDSFRAVSGPGHIEGTALLTLAGWRVIKYQGTIRGENFQTVYFPELQILSTPNLRFEGTPKKLTLRGELSLPELHIVGAESHTVVAPSSDVIREGSVVQPDATPPLELDVQVRVLLGEKVFVKVAGINAQLGGAVDLSMSSLDRIASKGEIKVVKGRYRTYGVNLEIVRGRLFFAGDTINRPTLDILALRTVGSVRAGVTVAGTLQRPVTKLYSEPAMPDVDVLAYIVLGHPLGSNGQQASLVAQAAGALLTSSKAAVLQDQIKNKLGLSTLEIQGGVGGTSTSMGYKTLQVTPPGAMPEAQQSGITETVLTVGKYLTPQLYISYGKSLFTGSNLFRLRYDIFKNWQIETQTGSGESGADLYYKMEFK